MLFEDRILHSCEELRGYSKLKRHTASQMEIPSGTLSDESGRGEFLQPCRTSIGMRFSMDINNSKSLLDGVAAGAKHRSSPIDRLFVISSTAWKNMR